uniref:(northern house mosquito) hypothetical protein n=1 Tax=Culex pipiens TaxID=7175 RepID=A0A8D8F9S2_CULPI
MLWKNGAYVALFVGSQLMLLVFFCFFLEGIADDAPTRKVPRNQSIADRSIPKPLRLWNSFLDPDTIRLITKLSFDRPKQGSHRTSRTHESTSTFFPPVRTLAWPGRPIYSRNPLCNGTWAQYALTHKHSRP